jgi:hypothetical protein
VEGENSSLPILSDRSLLHLLMPEGVPEVLEDEEEDAEPEAVSEPPFKPVPEVEIVPPDPDATQDDAAPAKATFSATSSRHASPERMVAPTEPVLSPARLAAPTVSQPTTPNRKSPQPTTSRSTMPFSWTPLSPSPSAHRRKFAIPPLLKWDGEDQMGRLRGLPDPTEGDEESAMRGLLRLIADDEEMEWEEPEEVHSEEDVEEVDEAEDDDEEGDGALLMMARTISERTPAPVPPPPIWPSPPKLAMAPAMQSGPAPAHPGYWPGPGYMGGYQGMSSTSPPRPPMMMQPPGYYYPPPGFGYGSPPGFRPGSTPMVRPVEGWN